MIVVRFKVRCQPARTDEMAAAMTDVIAPSRALPGVLHFDIGRDLTDPDALIATEVFEHQEALESQEALPEVGRVIRLVEEGALQGPPEWTIYEVASAESPG